MAQNRYAMSVTNRFNFGMDEDSDNQVESDQEQIVNVDPYTMLKDIEGKALKKAKQERKAAKEVKIEEPVEKEDKKPRRKEPVANNGPRRGRRNQDVDEEKKPRNDRTYRNRNDKGDENNNNQKDKRYKRPRDQDRKSGNPRTGVKSNEKKNGAGGANWGDPTDPKVYGDDLETEKPTPTSDANDENNDPEKSDAENKEPEEVTMTLEEYEKQNSAQVISSNKTAVRKPNNGEELKGTVIVKGKSDKIYVDDFAIHRMGKPQEKAKPILQANLISGGRGGFRHDALGNFNNRNNQRGGRGGGRGGRGRGGRQNFNRPNQADTKEEDNKSKEFSLVSEDYPTLGKAK